MVKELTERQKHILAIIVNAFIETFEPVGSRTISRKYHLEVSPATIRNEMSDLEESGFITHPHTSAGRMPTDLGYRYFIDHLLEPESISPEVACQIKDRFQEQIKWVDELVEKASRLLAGITKQTGIVSYPGMKELFFRRIDLRKFDGSQIWVVWTTTTGFSITQLVDLGGSAEEELLNKIANFFNEELPGFSFSEIPGEIVRRLSARRDSLYRLYEQAVLIGEEVLRRAGILRFCVEGSSHILEQPDFQDISRTTPIFRTLENREVLLELMKDSAAQDGVQVHVGRENKLSEIWDCSLIAANYKLHGKPAGVLGILGPRRMPYANLISYVDFISKEISSVLERWI